MDSKSYIVGEVTQKSYLSHNLLRSQEPRYAVVANVRRGFCLLAPD